MTRALRQRATSSLGIVPVTVTDRTCAAVLGLEPRVYRELVTRARIPHATIGRRVVTRVDDVLAALDRMAEGTAATPTTLSGDDGEEACERGPTADQILAGSAEGGPREVVHSPASTSGWEYG